jgi:hypothetical protein
MRNQPSATRSNQARRGWLSTIAGAAAALLGRKLVRPDARASSAPRAPVTRGAGRTELRSPGAPALVVRPAPNTVKRHG